MTDREVRDWVGAISAHYAWIKEQE